MKKAAFYTSGVVLGLGAVGHGLRLFMGFEIAVAGILVPMWMSLPAMIVGALLAVGITVAGRRS